MARRAIEDIVAIEIAADSRAKSARQIHIHCLEYATFNAPDSTERPDTQFVGSAALQVVASLATAVLR